MLQHGRDTYSYMWPRDGAISALALERAGDFNVAQRFFEFCNKIIAPEGYFMHKYRPDESLGSSWHPWLRDGKPELPIQEDETALVIFSLYEYYTLSKDIEFVESVYNSLIKKAAEFMLAHMDPETGLPRPSYDLWEEKYGVSTFTAASVYGALIAAAKFSKLLGKTAGEGRYSAAAARIKKELESSFYNEEEGMFYKRLFLEEGKAQYDTTIDISSVYGIYRFGVLPHDDARVVRSMKTIEKRLLLPEDRTIGGVPRYETDRYYRVTDEYPNPWFITTLWYVQYYIHSAKSEADLGVVKKWLSWVVSHAQKTGMLSEQLHPKTGAQLSAAPLTWSHSEFVITVIEYLEKLEALGICKACNPVK